MRGIKSSIRRGAVSIAGVALLWGCASLAETNPFSEEGDPSPEIEIIVRNERITAVTAYVEWDGRNPRRMGEVSGGEAEGFVLPVLGQEVRVVFQVLGSGPDRGGIGRDGEAIGSDLESASVRPGDRFEWTFRSDGYVAYIRLPSRTQRE